MSAYARTLALLALLAPCFSLPLAAAENAFVIDKLLVGVHEGKDLDSAIIKVLPTGTQLEILKREGELAYVVDPEKVKGWVDAAYLTAERPAALRALELETEKTTLEERVKELETRLANAAAVPSAPGGSEPAPTGDAQVDALTRENTELKGKLSDERLRSGKLQTEVASLRSEVKNSSAPPDARVLELEHARDDLQAELAAVRDQLAEFEARANLNDSAALLPLVLRDYALWLAIALGVVIVLAFAGGAYTIDFLGRRRHGGFRI